MYGCWLLGYAFEIWFIVIGLVCKCVLAGHLNWQWFVLWLRSWPIQGKKEYAYACNHGDPNHGRYPLRSHLEPYKMHYIWHIGQPARGIVSVFIVEILLLLLFHHSSLIMFLLRYLAIESTSVSICVSSFATPITVRVRTSLYKPSMRPIWNIAKIIKSL